MEIIDYLRIMRKRIALLLLIPLLAAGAAAAFVLNQPQTYTATATVSTATLVGGEGDFTGTQANSQFVAAFVAAASSPRVMTAVAEAHDLKAKALADDLQVTPRGASSDMTVTYTGSNKDKVAPLLTDVVSNTLTAMFKPKAEAAEARREAAATTFKSATDAVAAYTKEVGIPDPRQAYQALLSQVNNLVQQQATLRATGYPSAASALDGPIKTAQTKLAGYGPILQKYNNLMTARDSAADDLATAQTAAKSAAAHLTAAESEDIVYLSPTTATSRMSTLVTLTVAAFGAGFLLALLLAVALELLRGATRSEDRHAGSAAVSAELSDAESRASVAGSSRRRRRAPVR